MQLTDADIDRWLRRLRVRGPLPPAPALDAPVPRWIQAQGLGLVAAAVLALVLALVSGGAGRRFPSPAVPGSGGLREEKIPGETWVVVRSCAPAGPSLLLAVEGAAGRAVLIQAAADDGCVVLEAGGEIRDGVVVLGGVGSVASPGVPDPPLDRPARLVR